MTIDAVVFDVDGVLVDTDASYTESVIRTVRWLVPDAPVDRPLIRLWRRSGDWNNDWDLSYGLYCWLVAAPRLAEGDAASRSLADLVAIAGANAELGYAAVQGVFEEHYNGTALAVARYGVTPRLHNDAPLSREERVMLEPGVIDELRAIGIRKLGIVTGRVRPDWEQVAGRIPLPAGVIVATDEDGRKPDPAPLRIVLAALSATGAVVVGDTLNDLRMTQAYARDGAIRAVCVIRCDADDDAFYRDAGAAATIRVLAELPAAILRLAAEPILGASGTVIAGVRSMQDLTAEQEAERQKDEFLSIVSHELKTPLTPLKALAQLLRLRLRRHRESGKPLDLDSLDTNLRTIERQVDRMSGLVNDLLEVSRAGQGRFELQPQTFDLAPMVRDVVQRYEEIAAEEGRLRLTADAPASVLITGDAQRLEQALTNLVGNAVKYSLSGGEVRIALAERDGWVSLAVSDHGIGIDADEIETLGKPFARGSKRAHTFSGMGIGLYLARLIAEGHGGSLVLASEGADKGTTVTMKLPREGPAS